MRYYAMAKKLVFITRKLLSALLINVTAKKKAYSIQKSAQNVRQGFFVIFTDS